MALQNFVDQVGPRIAAAWLNAVDLLKVTYDQSAVETALGIVPSYTGYPLANPFRYGAVGDGVTDDTLAVTRAINVASAARITAKLKGAPVAFLCTANISVPVGGNSCVDLEGDGWSSGGLKFSGAGVTTGLTFTGSSFDYSGTVRDLKIACVSSAKRGITFTNLNHPRVVRCYISGAAGCGVKYDTCLMGKLEETLFTGCGSATEGTVEVINSTTWEWLHSRISGGTTIVGGLLIDTTPNVAIRGGAIESCGVPIKVGSKASSTTGCIGGVIDEIDLENPGNGNMYIDLGAGLSGSAYVQAWQIRTSSGYPAGTTSVPYAVRFNQCQDVTVEDNNFGQAGTPTSTFELTGLTNLAVHIRPQRAMYATPWPYVRINSTWTKAAGPHLYWNSYDVPRGLFSQKTITGATPSVLVDTTQGGYYAMLSTNNVGATTVTSLSGGELGMEIYIFAGDGNTTLTHSTSTANAFNLTGGANLLLTNGKVYRFIHNGTLWVQV